MLPFMHCIPWISTSRVGDLKDLELSSSLHDDDPLRCDLGAVWSKDGWVIFLQFSLDCSSQEPEIWLAQRGRPQSNLWIGPGPEL